MTFVSDKWKTLSKKLLVENKFVHLWQEEVLRPDGKQSTYYIDRRDPFSIVIPITPDNQVYMVKQYRYSVASLSIEFPMGFSAGNSPRDTAIAELREEVGMTAGKIQEIGKFWYGPGRSDQLAYVYVAEDLVKGEQDLEDGEFIEVLSYPINKIGQMIAQGEILDGPTIVAYHYWEQYQSNK